jgi:NhaP-type Na+/H+ or K+/H+ antiporter
MWIGEFLGEVVALQGGPWLWTDVFLKVEFIKSNELLACFFAGAVMNWNDTIHVEDLHTHFSEGIDNLLDIAVFLTLGTILPWAAWTGPNSLYPIGKLVGFGFFVMLLRRLPAMLVLRWFMPMIRTRKEAFFVGWFGPVSLLG